MQEKRVKFTTTLPEDKVKQLKEQAVKEGRSANKILQDLIEIYLEYTSSNTS